MHAPQTRRLAITVLQWVTWADQDYVAGRGLLLNGLLVQGCVFSNTTIEKYLKAILSARGSAFAKIHNAAKLYDECKKTGSVPPVNEGYLRTLFKAYTLRYPDDLAEGFNIALVQTKLLAELDATVFALRAPFKFKKPDGSVAPTRFEQLLGKDDARIKEKNAAFTSFARTGLFTGNSECLELRVLPGGAIIEATYSAKVHDDGVFDVEALKPGASTTK
jgi:HEPN domain-containing protein